jgi:hypothetical protein
MAMDPIDWLPEIQTPAVSPHSTTPPGCNEALIYRASLPDPSCSLVRLELSTDMTI